MSAKSDHMRQLATAARRWGEVNADFAEASDRLAGLMLVSANHAPPDHPTTKDLNELAAVLLERAAYAREDALDSGDLAARVRSIAEENESD